MFKNKIFLIVAGIISLSSCEDVLDKFTKFTIDSNTSFTVPATTVLEVPVAIDIPEAEVDSSSEFDSNNSRKDLVESAKFKSIVLEIETPASGNFDFLNEIELFISADGVEEAKIASISDIQEGQTRLVLKVEDVELQPYIIKDKYAIRSTLKVDKTVDKDHKINVISEIDIDAKILGI